MACRSVVPIAVFLVGALSGCGAGWRRPPEIRPGAWSSRQQVQVWSRGQLMQWHAVVVGPDSISGVPFTRPVNCDSCRVGIAREAVDSVRLGNPVAGFWKAAALTVSVALGIYMVACGSAGGCIVRD